MWAKYMTRKQYLLRLYIYSCNHLELYKLHTGTIMANCATTTDLPYPWMIANYRPTLPLNERQLQTYPTPEWSAPTTDLPYPWMNANYRPTLPLNERQLQTYPTPEWSPTTDLPYPWMIEIIKNIYFLINNYHLKINQYMIFCECKVFS
jgi:hypothetical protein